MSRSKKYQAWVFGLWAENRAVWMLRIKGYRVLERRYKSRVGEIDIIARRGAKICFIEVKGRNAPIDETPVTRRQMQRISRASQSFMQLRSDLQGFEMRFDVIIVRPGHWPLHLVDAWRP